MLRKYGARQVSPGDALRAGADLFGCAAGDDPAALVAAARAHIHDIVGAADEVEVVLDHEDGRAAVDEALKDGQQRLHVERVQADGGLVEDEDSVALAASHFAGELEPLRLAAGETGSGFAQGEVAQAQIMQRAQSAGYQLQVAAGGERLVDALRHELGQGMGCAVPAGPENLGSVPAVARAAAVGTDDLHVGQELDVQADGAGAVAGGAAQRAGIIGKVAGLVIQALRVGRAGVDLAQLVVHAGVGGHGGADVDADGRGVDQLDLGNAGRADRLHVLRQRLAAQRGLQPGNQALEDQRGLARAGHAGDGGQPALGEPQGEGLHGVNWPGGHFDRAQVKQVRRVGPRPGLHLPRARKKAADLGARVGGDLRDRALGDDVSALRAGGGAHFDEPVRVLEDLGIVIDQHDRVAVGDQVAHHAAQALDVRGMQADGRLVEHVEHAGGAVAHRAGQLHPLPFTGGEGGSLALERQVPQAQLQQPGRHAPERIADALGRAPHFLGQGGGHLVHPAPERAQRHAADVGQAQAANPGRTGALAEPGAAAVGAGALLEEAFDALHALFIRDLGERVFDGIDGVKVGEVHFARRAGLLVLVK